MESKSKIDLPNCKGEKVKIAAKGNFTCCSKYILNRFYIIEKIEKEKGKTKRAIVLKCVGGLTHESSQTQRVQN